MIKKMQRILFTLFAIAGVTTLQAADSLDNAILLSQNRWAEIKYQMPEKEQAKAFQSLAAELEVLERQYPQTAEPLIWHSIVLSSYAGAVGGVKSITESLPAVRESRTLLERAEQLDPNALDGSVYTSLGALYYQVPGWPIGFGDKKVARRYLEKAVSEYPGSIDSNYFYGDFLFNRGEYAKAREVLQRALNTPSRPNRPLADEGRREEIEFLLVKIDKKLSN